MLEKLPGPEVPSLWPTSLSWALPDSVGLNLDVRGGRFRRSAGNSNTAPPAAPLSQCGCRSYSTVVTQSGFPGHVAVILGHHSQSVEWISDAGSEGRSDGREPEPGSSQLRCRYSFQSRWQSEDPGEPGAAMARLPGCCFR